MEYDTRNDEPIFNIQTEPTELNSLLSIGFSHVNFCEDSVYAEESSINRIVCGVFDGCSSGRDSHFVSSLITKILRKSIEDIEYGEFRSGEFLEPKSFCKELIRLIFQELKLINNNLRLKYDELLSTILIGVYDKSSMILRVERVGDGLIKINDKIIEFYEDHKSDYIGYHLSLNFDSFYDTKVKKYEYDKVNGFALSTHGIFSFRVLGISDKKTPSNQEIIKYLLSDREYRSSPNWLKNKLDFLKDRYRLNNVDDLGLVVFDRLTKNEINKK